MKNETLFKKDNKITVSVRENSFTVKLPSAFKHLIKDFSSKFLSYTYVWNKKARRKISTLDKSFFIKRDYLDYVTYTFTRESLMDFVTYLKFRGINILDKDEFEIIITNSKVPRDIDIKLKSNYKLREEQQKYQDAIINNNMPKALIEARPGFGKMQPLDSLIKIPDGWKRMGDIQLNDDVIAKDGTITKVIGIYPHGEKEIFKVTFTDGRSTECGAEHLWKVYTQDETEVIDTTTINSMLKNNIRCYIDLIDSEQNNDKHYANDGMYYGSFIRTGINNKINEHFFNGSTKQRLEVLKGILNTYTFDFSTTYMFISKDEVTIKDIQMLVWSLGGIAKYAFIQKQEAYALEIRCLKELDYVVIENNDFLYRHKLEIISIEKIGTKEAQCIMIEHPEHLYITDDYIVTHNTVVSLAIACAKKKRIMLLLPGYVDKWKKDVINVLDIAEDDIYVIQGKDSILKLIEKIRNKEEINYKVYVVSEASLMPYAEKDREKYGKDYIEIPDIIEYLEIGTILIDEIHEKFYQSFYLLLLINTQLLIGMTGTYTSGNSYVRKFQDILFPKKAKLNFIKIEKYTNTFAIDYELDNPKSAKYLQQNMYNHDTYETNTLIANRSKLLNFIDMLEHYFETAYLQNYKEGNKMVIFVASVRFATMLTRYFQDKYRQFDIRRYTSDDPFENILEPDVIISTLQSAGTAIDIPKLKVVFNTVVSVSEVRNIQSHGRLRKLENEEVLYYYFYSTSIPKHSSFHRVRTEQLKPYSKEFKFIKYSKKI